LRRAASACRGPARDGRVYYKVLGSGYPTVMLHACPAGAWSFDGILPEFAKDFTCYAVDMPGFDHSDLPDHPFTLDNFTNAIIDVMKDAGIERANFVGVRTGAIVSMNMAAKHPERVNKLAIEGSPGWNRREGKIIFEKIFYPDYDEIGNPRVHPYEEAVKNNPNLNRERHERIQDSIRRRPEWYRWCHDMHTGTDIAALMPMIQAPALVMFKEGDPLRRREQRFLESIKGSRLHIFPGPNGSSHEDNREEYIQVVKSFLLE
jgi:pimeloyl-ACP methyl ester carboxylesterase